MPVYRFNNCDFQPNFYERLGLKEQSSPTASEIRIAFREKAAKYHPDRTTLDSDKIKFSFFKEARDTIQNNDKKTAYDMELKKRGLASKEPVKQKRTTKGNTTQRANTLKSTKKGGIDPATYDSGTQDRASDDYNTPYKEPSKRSQRRKRGLLERVFG